MTQRVVVVPTPLDAVAPAVSPVVDAFPTLCQICLDVPSTVVRICGPNCLAEVCHSCLVQHLTASVYSFYPGVLPKVRCPVCLVLLNRNQWVKFVQSPTTEEPQQVEQVEQEVEQQVEQAETPYLDDNAHVLEKYVVLCRQSCGFQSPCCHNEDYTMLPERYSDSEDEDDEDAQMELPPTQVDALPELLQRGVDFCYHRVNAAELYAFMTETFKAHVDGVLWRLLPQIVDEERRAALLLRHLVKNPDTQTRCCGMDVCFKCKATDHHNGDCRDFVEVESVVECRGCGVTVVMVDGCDSLRCLCGFSFSWTAEVERQKAQRKQIAPVENAEYDEWERWHGNLRLSLDKVQDLKVTQRELRLVHFVRDYRSLLRRLLLPTVYRKRLSKQKSARNAMGPVVKMKVIAENPLEATFQLHEGLARSQSVP